MADQENRPMPPEGASPSNKESESRNPEVERIESLIEEIDTYLQTIKAMVDANAVTDRTALQELIQVMTGQQQKDAQVALVMFGATSKMSSEWKALNDQFASFQKDRNEILNSIGSVSSSIPDSSTAKSSTGSDSPPGPPTPPGPPGGRPPDSDSERNSDEDPNNIEAFRQIRNIVQEYRDALNEAKSRGVHFDPRTEFRGHIPLLRLAEFRKALEVWIPEKGSSISQLRTRNEILNVLKLADALVEDWKDEIAAIDNEIYLSWPDPINSAERNLFAAHSGESDADLNTHDDSRLQADIADLTSLKARINTLRSSITKRFPQDIIDQILRDYPGLDVDPLFTKQQEVISTFDAYVQKEIERRRNALDIYSDEQTRLLAESTRFAAEQARLANEQAEIAAWRSSVQPLVDAVDAVINPSTPLGQMFNKDWVALRNSLEIAERSVRVHLTQRDEYPEISRLINQLKAQYSEALDRVTPILKVSPQDSWRTFAWKENFIPMGSDPREQGNWDAVEKGVINWILGYVTHEVWQNPLDPTKKSEIDTLGAPVDKSADKLAIRDVLYNHPDMERSKVVREQLEIMHHILEGGINWGGIIATPDHKKIMEHFEHFMFDGGTYHELSHMPALGNEHVQPGYTEPGFGETVFEGMSWYAYWNNRFIYATPAEYTEIENKIEDCIRNQSLFLPTENELRKVYDQIKDGDTDAQLRLGSESELETRAVLRLFYVDAKQDHAKFIELLKAENRNRKIIRLESKRQVAFGIHPLREIGDEIRETGGVAERALNIKRRQLAIALGCYRLGLGDYTPDLRSLTQSTSPVTNKSGILVERQTGQERRLTPDEEKIAYEAGQPAELFAFSGYICNGNQIVDDDVTAKSAVTAGRLTQTQKYRTGYAEIGREGFNMESVKMFKQILPTPWMYMGLNGKTMKALLADRHERVHAPYLNLGTGQSGAKRKFIELYDFSAQIYDALSYGMQNVEPNVNILDLATVERPKTFFSREEILKFKDKDIQKLIRFVEKVVGYYIDRLFVNTADVNARGSIYPKNFWREVPGTNYSSPLPGLMVNLPSRTLETLKEETNRSGFKRAWVKVFLSPMIIESVLRSYSNEINLSDRLALGFVLAGSSTAPYGIRGAETEGSRLAVPDFSKTFGYTSEQVSEIIAAANLNMKSGWSVFFQEMGGV